MPIWKFLHIVAMFSSVTLLVGGDLLFHALRRTGDTASLRRFLAAVTPIFAVGVALLTLGIAFGLATAATGSWSFTAGWLLMAYVLIAALYLVGMVAGLPYYRAVAAVLARDETAASPDARGALDDVRGIGSMLVSVAGYVTIIFLMVVKPFA